MRLPGIVLGCLAALAVAESPKRHILFIVLDDLRPEMTPYLHDYMVTPNFQRLANKSLVFDRAYVQQAVCAPSRNSFMSGRRPDKTHAWNFIQHMRDEGVGDKWTTFPGLLKKRGFLTLGAGKLFHPNLPPNFDGTNSWSNFSNNLPFFDPLMLSCPDSSGLKKCSTEDNATFADNLSIDRLVSLMHLGLNSTDQPLALFCGLHKPHLPFRRPKSFDKLYPDWNTTDLALHRVIPDGTPLIAWHDTGDNKNPWTPHPDTDERETRHAYRATVSFADSMVGRMLDELDAAGIANDTAIFLWSDHGWQLSEHGQWRKMTIFELATRVPLMVHVPWLPQGHGKRTSAIAELVDMMPTAAAVMGIDLMSNETVDGTSLLPVLEDPTASVKDSAFSQYPRCPQNTSEPWKHNACLQVNDTDFYAMGYSIRVDNWRYSEWPRWEGNSTVPDWSNLLGVELYSHQDDQIEKDFNMYENENLAGQDQYKTVQAQLSQQLRSHFQTDGCTPFVNCD